LFSFGGINNPGVVVMLAKVGLYAGPKEVVVVPSRTLTSSWSTLVTWEFAGEGRPLQVQDRLGHNYVRNDGVLHRDE
jgi:hypothetical protein